MSAQSLPTLFISDLHLNDKQPEIYQRFKLFIDNKAQNAKALYILGDLFEYYLGDDALSPLMQSVAKDLRDLSNKHGVKCYFMHGNRDFLVSSDYAELANFELLPDPFVLSLKQNTNADSTELKVILTHADQLCTDDKEYQAVRAQIRNPQWCEWFLSQSVQERIDFANNARQQSQEHTQKAASEIMDVNPNEVQALFEQYETPYMIHGHTHRPAFHDHRNKHMNYRRMVLGDWHLQASYIECQNGHFKLLTC